MLDRIAEVKTLPKQEDEKIEILPELVNELTQQKQYSFVKSRSQKEALGSIKKEISKENQ